MDVRKRTAMRSYRFIGDTTAFNAEMWSAGMLVTLEEEIVVSNIFNRDFETDFAEKGDTVNARRLGKFSGDRLESGGTLNYETPDATNVIVKLDQHITSAFPILDRDNHKSFKELVPLYIVPAARAMIEQIDLIAQGEKYNFWKNQHATGAGNGLTYAGAVLTNKVLTDNLCERAGRWLIGGSQMEADTLLTDKFTDADKTGDGSPLINGRLARGAGFTLGMSQMFNETSGETYTTTSSQANGAGAIGDTTLIVDNDDLASGALSGTFFKTLAGNIHRITVDAPLTTNAGTYTFVPALFGAIADDELITFYTAAAVNNGAGYAVGHSDWITFDGTPFTTRPPRPGDGVAFGLGTVEDVYGILKVSGATFKLNRPLDAAIADDDLISPFPANNYNLAMVPGAATLVVKPMQLPPAGSGVAAAIARENGWAFRFVQSYDHDTFKNKVSFDTLVGVKTTNTDQGALMITQ